MQKMNIAYGVDTKRRNHKTATITKRRLLQKAKSQNGDCYLTAKKTAKK